MNHEAEARKLAELANTCCHRSDGYEELMYAHILQALNMASNEGVLAARDALLDALDDLRAQG